MDPETVDAISQIGIGMFGVTGIFLVSMKNRWGFICGMASQPFWIATSYINEQWAIFVLTLAYTFVWGNGIYQWFFKKKEAEEGVEAEAEEEVQS